MPTRHDWLAIALLAVAAAIVVARLCTAGHATAAAEIEVSADSDPHVAPPPPPRRAPYAAAASTHRPLLHMQPAASLPAFGNLTWPFDTLASAYGLSAAAPSAPTRGSGVVVAVVAAFGYPTAQQDVLYSALGASYDVASHLRVVTMPAPQGFVARPGADAATRGWRLEQALDIQTILCMAPGVSLVLVQAYDDSTSALLAAVEYAVGPQVRATVVNMSWGGGGYPCMLRSAAGPLLQDPFACSADTLFAEHSGVVFVAASGDDGSGTIWPMTHPNVLAVGGTTLRSITGSTVVESGWVGSGGGTDPYYSSHAAQSAAFGQRAMRRLSPDLAAVADPRTGVRIWCADYFPAARGGGAQVVPRAQVVGGTSLAAPVVAAILATANGLRLADRRPALTQAQVLGTIYGRGFSLPGSGGPDPLFRDTLLTGVGREALSYSVCVPGFDLVTGRGSPRPEFLLALVAAP